MTDFDRPGPQAVRLTVGAPLAPEPSPANYNDEIPEEMYALIDELCLQSLLSGGQTLSRFEW